MRHIVRTFSRVFPAYHPRAGEPTYFAEKIIWSLHVCGLGDSLHEWKYKVPTEFVQSLTIDGHEAPKFHTIRAGHHFKPGDFLVPRVWSGKPYKSKQIQIAPPIEIVKTWDFKIIVSKKREPIWLNDQEVAVDTVGIIAGHDGLSFIDFMHWFKYPGTPFDGQIICWNKSIEYLQPIKLTAI